MKKIIAGLFAIATVLWGASAYAGTYVVQQPTGCYLAHSPLSCGGFVDVDGDGSGASLWVSWGASSSTAPPSVGQTVSLGVFWLTVRDGQGGSEDVVWFQGVSPGTCSGSIANTGQWPAPYTVSGSCTGVQFTDGTLHSFTFTENLYIFTARGRTYWELVSGSVTLN